MKIKFHFDTKKLEKELNKQMKEIIEKEQYKIDLENKKGRGRMNILQPMEEEAFKIILEQYDGNKDNSVSGTYDIFPKYMQYSFKDIFERLKIFGLLASYCNYISGWRAYLTPNGKTYFEDKKKYLQRESNSVFNKLPSNSRKLLKEMLDADNPTDLLDKKFDLCNSKEEDIILRGIIGELCDLGLIKVSWADNIPNIVHICYLGTTYFERESEYERMQKKSSRTVVNIGNFNANGSNVVMGDVSNSTLSIDNSILNIQKKIDEKGGEDKEQLKEILDEAKELIENINNSRTIPKNKGFIKRLTSHFDKHGWFYAEIVSLIGNAVLNLF